MCGRFTLRTPPTDIALLFDLDEVPTWEVRYNICPTQTVPVIRAATMEHRLDSRPRPETSSQTFSQTSSQTGPRYEAVLMRWGLIPHWAREPDFNAKTFNARADTASDKPTFRDPFRLRRCVVVTDGFFEWRRDDGNPFFIHRQDDKPMLFAGLWDRWCQGNQNIESCTILTTDANPAMSALHDRMPVILDVSACATWLHPGPQEVARLQARLRPYSGNDLILDPVTPWVNKSSHEGPRCLEPPPPTDWGLLAACD